MIDFVVCSAIVAFKRSRSSEWIPAEARVTKAAWHFGSAFECGSATVQYKYSIEGHEYRGTSVEPFFDGWLDGPVQVLPPGTTTQIRYDPMDPSKSILIERWWITRRGSPVHSDHRFKPEN
jgi:hypothetical protein